MATTKMEYDTTRARAELGYTSIPAREALRRAAAWFVENEYVKPARVAKIDPAGSLSTPAIAPADRARPDAAARGGRRDVSIVKALLDARGTEGFALHERYMNPQMPQILRTIGFDKDYVRAEGAYLFDRDGNRYLDFLAGFGVFALGRCHPVIEQALRDAIALAYPNLVQIECPPLSGLLAEALVQRMPTDDYRVLLHEQRRRIRRDGVEVRAVRDRTRASPLSPTTHFTVSPRARCR